jgi:hypothetical protein
MKGEDEAPFQKIPTSSVSPPCHTKVTLLMAEICDPMSAFERVDDPKIENLSALKFRW